MSSSGATQILVLPGSSALSVAKRATLLHDVQTISARITSIDVVHLHLVECADETSRTELSSYESSSRQILNHLLDYDDDVKLEGTVEAFDKGTNVVYVVPRAGSISPWSSKATDISGLCGLRNQVRRIERGVLYALTFNDDQPLAEADLSAYGELLHDRMTQTIHLSLPPADSVFVHRTPAPLRVVDFVSNPATAEQTLSTANRELGLALSTDEMTYLLDAFVRGANPLARAPTDAELFMFAQVNSEHCRHKIFNASWTVDGQTKEHSLFSMIRNTERISPRGTISAYSDNAAVLEGFAPSPRFSVAEGGVYKEDEAEDSLILIKVETHNHPTAVSPYPGAATGSGGEIRDEGAVGRGSRPKAGLVGYAVSNLLLPGFEQPWEEDVGKPAHIASAREIMLHAPLGAAAFNDEFGRPALAGFFRTLCEREPGEQGRVRGFHKPIMLAGGLGNVRPTNAHKTGITAGAHLIVLGGPGLLIGLGGGAASSQSLGSSSAALDFASVQRDNAEMQRRCQMVIDACAHGLKNPVQSIHDVGAGGLSNALPELVHDAGLGALIEIRDVLVADAGMSPMEIWCNESQERYVLAIAPEESERFAAIAKRERCPFAVVGVATEEVELIVTDRLLKEDVIRLKMSTLFGKPPRMSRSDDVVKMTTVPFDVTLAKYLPDASPSSRLAEAVKRVLQLPSVASKSFLITIGDRSVTGLVARDQMVGPWQVPVADVAVTRAAHGFNLRHGEAMAIGERTPAALLSAPASARMAVGEALTNLAAADVPSLSHVKLSANWMCAAGTKGEGAALYAAVQAVGMELCPALGLGIPVGKDSMSMAMRWKDEEGKQKEVTAPLSLVVTAFTPVEDIRRTWTPQLRTDIGAPTVLVLIDLGAGRQRLGASALAQVFREFGQETPDVENSATLRGLFDACRILRTEHPEVVLAYHDRSDGGLLATVAEMAFAGRVGVEVSLDVLGADVDPLSALFNEELGAVVQVREQDLKTLMTTFVGAGVPSTYVHVVGRVNQDPQDQTFKIIHTSEIIFSSTRDHLQELWSETSYRMQALRDEPEVALEEHSLIHDSKHSGLFYDLKFTPSPTSGRLSRPKVAILREQGVNGHLEMAWSFSAAGFESVDVHMSDILSGSVSLAGFRGLAACGGFSYGDVLGAGKGWAHSALLQTTARKEFEAFFTRTDTFTLGVCNGCQFLSHMKELVPGAAVWPAFRPNRGGRFEARVSMVEIPDGGATRSSVFLRHMAGSRLPVAVAHGEGRAAFASAQDEYAVRVGGLTALRYVDGEGKPTERYPLNPNGSPEGIAGVQTPDGRVLALMPHPERVTLLEANSWYPPNKAEEWKGVGPWFKLFQSARQWCG